jgi:hypothetical protein
MTVTKNERIYGKKLGLTIDGVDYWADVSKYELTPDEKGDAVTFADAYSGATPWKLKGTAIVSTATGSFWDKVWEAAGQTVPFILAPHGNKTAAVGKPHFTGNVTIPAKPGISSEAGDDKGSTFDFEWDVQGEPGKVTTGSTLGTGSLEETEG